MWYQNKYYLCNVFDSKKEYCFIILNFKEMKKLVYSLAVLFSIAMVSCGGNKAAETADTVAADSVEVTEVAEVAADSNETVAAVAETVEAAPVADSAK